MQRKTIFYTAGAVALALGLSGGVAVGAAKVTASQIAKDAVRAKHIKHDAVRSDELKDGSVTAGDLASSSVTGAEIAGGSVTNDKLAGGITSDQLAGAITGDKLVGNTVTGTQVDESTLATVPNATAVGGMAVRQIALSIPSVTDWTVIDSGAGYAIQGKCDSAPGGGVGLEVDRVAPGNPPITIEYTRFNGDVTFMKATAGTGHLFFDADAANAVVTVYRTGGASTVIHISTLFANNAFGSNDCFYRGTVTESP